MEGSATVGQGFRHTLITPQHLLTDEVDTDFYGYQIWLGTTDDGLPFSMMEGLRGQMVVSVPALDMVVVRTGYTKSKAKSATSPWPPTRSSTWRVACARGPEHGLFT